MTSLSNSHNSNFETPESHAKDSVKTAVNERIRISIEHRSRIFVRLSDPTMSTLRGNFLEARKLFRRNSL